MDVDEGDDEGDDEDVDMGVVLYDRYLLALVLLVATIIAFAAAGDGPWGRLTSVAIEGATLVVILRSSRVHNRVLVAATTVVVVALVGGTFAALAGGPAGERGPMVIGALLAILGPPAIIRRVLSHHQIDLTTIAGALCIYLLAGLFYAYLFGIVGDFDQPFFAQDIAADGVDYVYFSFVTLATLGYGDLTARSDLGRMLAVTEAVTGQLYLVSAVALLVGNLGRTRNSFGDNRRP